MVVIALAFFVTAFDTCRIKSGCIAGLVGTEQIDGHAKVEIQVTLNRRQINHASRTQFADIVGFEFVHGGASALNHTADA